jgi:electron-transferring-flavoprotein dehydrogenase
MNPVMELHGKQVFLSEGVRVAVKQVIAKYDLARIDVQKYGLGMKEIWEIDPAATKRRHRSHDGWPL